MNKLKEILVTTAASVEGYKILKHLNPISAHVVVGTNIFSDFLASITDIIGGRSNTYQKQLSSIYQEAIDKLKISAYEIGANSIIGLKVDLDEISGKGKSMFMVTAMGTAVVTDYNPINEILPGIKDKVENVNVEDIKILQTKKDIINKAKAGNLRLEKGVWEFITSNKVFEVYDFIIGRLREMVIVESDPSNVYQQTINFLDVFPDETKIRLIYDSIIKEDNIKLLNDLCGIIKKLHLLDFDYINEILKLDDFKKQKLAIRLLTYDKPYYNKSDIIRLKTFVETIKNKFPERGAHSTKKIIFSSKEKDVWICECKTQNEIGTICQDCFKDIYGFISSEISPQQAISLLEEKISLLSELLQ